MSSSTEPRKQPERLGYDEYRDSGVVWLGNIPSHWQVARVQDYTSIITGHPFDSDKFSRSSGTPLIRIRDIKAGWTGTRYKGEPVNGAWVKEGDVIIGMDGDFNVRCWDGPKAQLNQRLSKITSQEGLLERYLYYLLPFPLEVINDLTWYTTVKHLSKKQIRKIDLPLPPLNEQRAIAAYLDRETERIDALIEKKEQLIDLLEEKRTALISRVVTKGIEGNVEMQDSGVEWLGEIPAHWESSRLKWCTRQDTSICYGIVQPGDHVEDGVPFVQTTNISTGTFELDHLQRTSQEIAAEYSRSRLEAGDVILGIRASIGSAYVVPKELEGANLSRGIARIAVNDEVQPEYLKFYLSSNHAENYWSLAQQGATFSEVSIANVRELSVPLPPLAEQHQIANYLAERTERIDRLISKVNEIIDRLKEYRTALISAAVTGQIDVRGKIKI